LSPKIQTVARDPVCGMTVEPSSAAAERVHEGQTFYFCAKGCAERFEKDPKTYLNPPLKGSSPAKVAPSPLPAGRALRETRPSVAAGAEASGGGPPEPPRGGRGGKQAPLFEIKSKSAFLRQPPVSPPAGAPLAPAPPPVSRVALAIEGMHCASCVATIEDALSAVVGVTDAADNLATVRADVAGSALNPRRLIEAVRSSGIEGKSAEGEDAGKAEEDTAGA
jgi:YHS domain-containing protein/copper chaperone CopZ